MSEETEKIKVLLVDDQALIRMGFRMVLEACDDIEVVGEAADGKTALGMVRALQPNVVLMDVRMPNMNGIEATGEISPRITKKMLDMFAPQLPDENAGADAAGAGATSADAVALASLTERETEVLKLIAHGMTNQELADKLFISMTTVKTHVGNILNKIGARDRVQAVIFAYENGLVN